jgi:hypothetical protein
MRYDVDANIAKTTRKNQSRGRSRNGTTLAEASSRSAPLGNVEEVSTTAEN